MEPWERLIASLCFTVRYEKWPTRIPLSPPVLILKDLEAFKKSGYRRIPGFLDASVLSHWRIVSASQSTPCHSSSSLRSGAPCPCAAARNTSDAGAGRQCPERPAASPPQNRSNPTARGSNPPPGSGSNGIREIRGVTGSLYRNGRSGGFGALQAPATILIIQ